MVGDVIPDICNIFSNWLRGLPYRHKKENGSSNVFCWWEKILQMYYIFLTDYNNAKAWMETLVRWLWHRDHFVYAPSQWEPTLQRNVISHWLSAYTKSFCVYVSSEWEATLQCNVASHWPSAYTKWSLMTTQVTYSLGHDNTSMVDSVADTTSMADSIMPVGNVEPGATRGPCHWHG